MNTEKKLHTLLDFQRFMNHEGLNKQIEEARARYAGRELSDADLEMVAAAGEFPAEKEKGHE